VSKPNNVKATHVSRLPAGLRQVDTGERDDGLPRGFLAGAIMKMWVAHRLDKAGELLAQRGEELAQHVGSEHRCLLVNEIYHSRFSLYSNPNDSIYHILVQTHI